MLAMTSAMLAIEIDGGYIRLLSPEVGLFTRARTPGESLAPGEIAGVLVSLGREIELIVPEGASGVVVSKTPERARQPVGYGDVLYELASEAGAERAPRVAAASVVASGGLALRAQQSGRFYHRPAPNEPAFVAPDSIVKDGTPIGMIEVMKTFSHVIYRSGGALPARARVVRIVARDGADVKIGDVLLELAEA